MCAKYYELRCMFKKIHLKKFKPDTENHANIDAISTRQHWRDFRCPV